MRIIWVPLHGHCQHAAIVGNSLVDGEDLVQVMSKWGSCQ
jgi:hypothetical protein